MFNTIFGSLAFALVLIMGFALGAAYTRDHYQSEAVKHGAARYNPATAAFEWHQPSGGEG